MKRKFTRILGVVLPLAMVLALGVALLPASAPPAEAAVESLKFSHIPLPKIGAEGDYVLTPGTDVGPIAVSPEGSVVFAAMIVDGGYNLMKSADGGYSWTELTGFTDTYADALDETSIVDIVVSPEYSSDTTLYVVTQWYIYESVDGGKRFTADQPEAMGDTEFITDIDIALDEGGRLSVIVGTSSGVVVVELVGEGNATAEWATTGIPAGYSGSSVVKFTIPATNNWVDMGKVNVTYNQPLADFACDDLVVTYCDDAVTGPNPFPAIYLDTTGDGAVDYGLGSSIGAVIEGEIGDWQTAIPYDAWRGCPMGGPQEGEVLTLDEMKLENNYAGHIDLTSATIVYVALEYGWNPTDDPAVLYVDDFTINGTTYYLEEDGAHTFLGDVYVYCPATTGRTWQAQGIGTHDVLAAAFSPNFATDGGIFAVTVSDEVMTEIQVALGYTKDGGGWGTDIGSAEFLSEVGSTTYYIEASRASIGFPDDFDIDSITSNIAFVGLSEPNYYGDAFKVTFHPTRSSTLDLNARDFVGTARTGTNIWSIDVSGDAEAANVLVGTDAFITWIANYYWTTYYSTDSGETWLSARDKSPTGGNAQLENTEGRDANTYVVMAPDFGTSGVAYAGTSGAHTSAFSRTADGGKSWNQISLIDYGTLGKYYVTFVTADGVYPSTNTLYMVTGDYGPPTYALPCGAVWKTTNGGANYERIWSYANPGVTQTINGVWGVGTTPEETYLFSTIFAIDTTEGKFWRSSDSGATFPRVVTAKEPGIKTWLILDPNTIWTGYDDGVVWYTTKLGRPWVEPDESVITGTVAQISKKGDIVLVPTVEGKVFISTDGGETFADTLGVTDPGTAKAKVGWDDNYDTNHYVYASIAGEIDPDSGNVTKTGHLKRIEVNEDAPGTIEWERMDNWTDVAPSSSPLTTLYGSALYVTDAALGGGIWRCVNPDADIKGTSPPFLEKVDTGLESESLALLSAGVLPNFIIALDGKFTEYYNQLLIYADTLGDPVSLLEPADETKDAGMALSTTDLTKDIILSWEAVPGAIEYQVLVCNDAACDSVADGFTTEGQEKRFEDLIPGKTYYWMVRVTSPLRTPWSELRSFTIGAVEPEVVVVPFDIVSPERGATNVSIQPTFVWAEVEGATSYELVVAEDPTFAIIDWSRTSANTFYKAEEALAYDSTYAWKVRAAPDGPWATGVFTTEAVPPEPVAPTVIEPTQPADIVVQVPAAEPAIPTYLLWTISGIGAVLFIALIVLIVRTRRVT